MVLVTSFGCYPQGSSTSFSYTPRNCISNLHNYPPKPKYLIIGSFGPLKLRSQFRFSVESASVSFGFRGYSRLCALGPDFGKLQLFNMEYSILNPHLTEPQKT